jgi:hypothetical protein
LLFLGSVCSEWRDVYPEVEDQQVCSFDFYLKAGLVPCGSKTTPLSVVVASPATARLACEYGVQICTQRSVQVNAGLYADIETLTVLRVLGMPLSEIVVKAVALSGRLSVLQHLLSQQQCPRPEYPSSCAARSGSIDMLKWLRAQSWCEFNLCNCIGAVEGGQLAALKYLRSKGYGWNERTTMRYAAGSGSIELVEWLRLEQGIEIDADAMMAAAGEGQTVMCEHLRSKGCDWDESACYLAALHDKADTLRWLGENGCPWDVSEICMVAACNGFTGILDCIIAQGEVLDAKLLTRALNRAGQLKRLQAAQWLRQHGAQWPALLKFSVAGLSDQWSGDTLAWARAEGCTSPLTDVSDYESDGDSEFEDEF